LLASTASKVPVAFAVGFISIVLPCVLPLVPGYLSAVSAIEAGRLGERGVARRVVLASIPFIVGFTVVFVLLGAGAAAIGSVLNKRLQLEFAGFLLVVVGLGFVGLLPWPERAVAPGLLARARGSSILLGAAFALCAAPCIGAVLGSILALAASSGTVLRGVVLPVGAEPLRDPADRRRRDPDRARPAPLLRSVLVAERRRQPDIGEGRARPDLTDSADRPGSACGRRHRGGEEAAQGAQGSDLSSNGERLAPVRADLGREPCHATRPRSSRR
jgi:cytochrome c biogenesis protein CcdA